MFANPNEGSRKEIFPKHIENQVSRESQNISEKKYLKVFCKLKISPDICTRFQRKCPPKSISYGEKVH